ncbi:MAG: hypothetical protein HKUEN01_01160 [Candidatus Kuenenia stuttgartiensis]|nr:MAG: hypothetical protein HKUEN01_01160 [Candidatus Kuenenia stuttgartiensis]
MKAVSSGKRKKAKTDFTEGVWNLRLYVAGQTPKSITAFANLKRICEEHLTNSSSRWRSGLSNFGRLFLK